MTCRGGRSGCSPLLGCHPALDLERMDLGVMGSLRDIAAWARRRGAEGAGGRIQEWTIGGSDELPYPSHSYIKTIDYASCLDSRLLRCLPFPFTPPSFLGLVSLSS